MLKAPRYHAACRKEILAYIEQDVPFLDFDEANAFYDLATEELTNPELRVLACNDRFFLLTRLLNRPDANHPWIYDRCREVEAEPDGYLDLWARYHYKAVDIKALVPTPQGWRRHGDLKPGDQVFGPDGLPCNVIARTPVFTDADCYAVTFDKGYEVVVSGDHLWTVDVHSRSRTSGTNQRNKRKTITLNTRELLQEVDQCNLIKSRVLPSVPVAMPVEYPSDDLLIPPYVLGAWLGDGASHSGRITIHPDDDQILDHIRKEGYKVERRTCYNATIYKLLPDLRKIGVWGRKHIPLQYLYASIESRWDLLCGLMDTDGHCDTRGTATFVSKSEILAANVFELAASLGLKPQQRRHLSSVNNQPYPYFHVSFQCRKNAERAVFGLDRKQARATTAPASRSIRHAIVSVRRVPSIPVSCIQVDRKDGLYLIGEHFIATHNSTVITFAGSIQELLIDPEVTIAIFAVKLDVARPFLEQIKDELERNEVLHELFPDVLYDKPRRDSPSWSVQGGITVKRKGNPKEKSIEAFGLIDGMPTGRHFRILVYDDLINEKLITNPEMIKKTTERWEMSDNLGCGDKTRKWHSGTRYCTRGDMRVLMADWTHKRIEDVRIGDTVVGWELKNGKRFLRPAKVLNRGVHFLQPVNRYTFDHGRTVVCTADHLWWRGAHGSGAEYQPLALPRSREGRSNRICQPRGTMASIRELLTPVDIDQSREAGWLAGMFDGEGTTKKNKGHPSGVPCIVQTDHNPELVEEIRRVLKDCGFQWSESWIDTQEGWSRRCVFTVNGGWRERYRFLAEIAPAKRRDLAPTLFGHMHTQKHHLVAIEDAGKVDVHWLETETGNYVVEGFCSSNSFADTYGVLIERGVLKPRIYPATENGRLDGEPVFLTQEHWTNVKRNQVSTVNAQMLQNPLSGKEQMFQPTWFRSFILRPTTLNVYILVDPSKGRSSTSDRTAMVVIGIDANHNKYLLDGFRHRMNLSERFSNLVMLWRKWSGQPGVQICRVGYEVYGMQTDDEFIRAEMIRKYGSVLFELEEINWARDSASQSKRDRVERLEPDFRNSQFFLPPIMHHEKDGECYWRIEDTHDTADKSQQLLHYTKRQGPNRAERAAITRSQKHLIVGAIKRKDENGSIYDVTRELIMEAMFFPFAPKDDLIDCVSRIYDIDPTAPQLIDAAELMPQDFEDS